MYIMMDKNVGAKPYKIGDKLILEITVTDENKSFDWLGKTILNKIDINKLGFTVDSVSFRKDKYINNIPIQLRQDIQNELNKAFSNISDLLKAK